MAKADADTTTVLVLRLHLHKAGLRLRSSAVSFEILFGNQTLLSGNAHGEALSIGFANVLERQRRPFCPRQCPGFFEGDGSGIGGNGL